MQVGEPRTAGQKSVACQKNLWQDEVINKDEKLGEVLAQTKKIIYIYTTQGKEILALNISHTSFLNMESKSS